MAAAQLRTRGAGRILFALAALCGLRWSLPGFVQGPSGVRPPARSNYQLLQRASAVASGTAESSSAAASKDKDAGDKSKDIDDAVLRMAMAMAEEEEGGAAAKGTPEKQEEGFDFNLLVTAFWVVLIIYSFGSSIIGITQGRIQDRTGGDFTLYDFFDNIFVFSEWNLEYSLGFDPFKLFDNLKTGGSAPTA
eukprot:gb/GFBE01045367.1/.p1 GENE.gb/GFBE01045367.1/~~gb/GFBE01045367.1/.p1  ORF type:complete len:192 (+),score=59.44 gb/GFBE01045367.1/:1-576(+)